MSTLPKFLLLLIPIVLLGQCARSMKNSNVIPSGNNIVDNINNSSLSVFVLNNVGWILLTVVIFFALAIFSLERKKAKKKESK